MWGALSYLLFWFYLPTGVAFVLSTKATSSFLSDTTLALRHFYGELPIRQGYHWFSFVVAVDSQERSSRLVEGITYSCRG